MRSATGCRIVASRDQAFGILDVVDDPNVLTIRPHNFEMSANIQSSSLLTGATAIKAPAK